MGLIAPGARLLAAAFTFALIFALAVPAEAARRSKTRFDGIRDCERTGSAQFLRHNPAFKRFLIDRATDTLAFLWDKLGGPPRPFPDLLK